jgi:uncharacterized membrane protein (DUF485 family)
MTQKPKTSMTYDEFKKEARAFMSFISGILLSLAGLGFLILFIIVIAEMPSHGVPSRWASVAPASLSQVSMETGLVVGIGCTLSIVLGVNLILRYLKKHIH